MAGTVDACERDAAAAFGAAHAVATSSGTAALRCALAALGVGCGDEVVVPAFTFIATVNAVVTLGTVPVFAEIDDTSYATERGAELTGAIAGVQLRRLPALLDAMRANKARIASGTSTERDRDDVVEAVRKVAHHLLGAR